MTRVSCCAYFKNATRVHRQRSSMAAPCRAVQKAVGEPVTMVTSARRAAKVHVAVDTLGHLLAVLVAPANEQERAQVDELAKAAQAATQHSIKLGFGDQGYTGTEPAGAANAPGIKLEVIKPAAAKRGLCCCHAAGWSNAPSYGWRGCAACRMTTNGCIRAERRRV